MFTKYFLLFLANTYFILIYSMTTTISKKTLPTLQKTFTRNNYSKNYLSSLVKGPTINKLALLTTISAGYGLRETRKNKFIHDNNKKKQILKKFI